MDVMEDAMEEAMEDVQVDYLTSARTEYASENYERAEQYCKMCIREKGSLPLLASIYIKLYKFNEAEEIVKKIMETEPQQSETYSLLGALQQERGQIDESIRSFLHAISLNPDLPDIYIQLAEAYQVAETPNKAIETYMSALVRIPQAYKLRNNLGNVLKEVGRLYEAKQCFFKTVKQNPHYPLAWNNLGCMFVIEKEVWLAVHHFEKAVKLDPNYLEAQLNLGNVLRDAKIYERAAKVYSDALNISPNDPTILASLAHVYFEMRKLEMSIYLYKKALQFNFDYLAAHCNLANALKENKQFVEAEIHYNIALNLNPSHADTINNFANLKRQQGDVEKAISLFTRLLEVHPAHSVAHNNLAYIFHQKGDLDRALIHYSEALKTEPVLAQTYSNMGNILKEKFDYMGAAECYKKAIAINPSYADSYLNYGTLLKESGNLLEAIVNLKQALELKPNFPDAFCSLVHCQLIICDWTNYEMNVTKVVTIICEQLKTNKCFPSIHPHQSMLYPFPSNYHQLIGRKYSNICLHRINKFNKPCYKFSRNAPKRLKVGYVSSDFGNHPTSHLMQSLPGIHNKEMFHIYCYALNPDDGTTFRSKIHNECENFVDLSRVQCNLTAANMIYTDGIHILVNLNGYTSGARNEIFAFRPAPIQVLWLGYPGSSGSTFIDYLVTDQVTCPMSLAGDYSEKFAYMRDTFFIGDHKQMFPHLKQRFILVDPSKMSPPLAYNNALINTADESKLTKMATVKEFREIVRSVKPIEVSIKIAEISSENIHTMLENGQAVSCVNGVVVQNGTVTIDLSPSEASGQETSKGVVVTTRQQYGLPNYAMVYCNFNQLYKLDPATFITWVNILKRVPNSVLWIAKFPREGMQNLFMTAENLGISRERIVFSEVASKEEHVRRSQLADVCLDTTVCNGHTTNADILWAGTPVVTLPKQTSASRIGASLLCSLGLSELVASSPADYEAKAVRLGTDTSYLKLIRFILHKSKNESPLFNCHLFASNLELLYSEMWKRYENNVLPDHIVLDYK